MDTGTHERTDEAVLIYERYWQFRCAQTLHVIYERELAEEYEYLSGLWDDEFMRLILRCRFQKDFCE